MHHDIKVFLDKVIKGNDLILYLSERVRTHASFYQLFLKKQRERHRHSALRQGLYHFHFAPKDNRNPKGRNPYLIFVDVLKDIFTITAIAPHSVFEHHTDSHPFLDIRRRYL